MLSDSTVNMLHYDTVRFLLHLRKFLLLKKGLAFNYIVVFARRILHKTCDQFVWFTF